MTKPRLAVLIPLLGLAACAGIPQSVGEASMFYRDYLGPPEGSARALVRLSADGVIRVTPGSLCADFSKPSMGVALFSTYSLKDYSHLHNRKLGVLGSAPEGIVSTEIALEAGKPAVLSYARNWVERGTAYTCHVHRSFTPEANAHYQLVAEPVFAEKSCRVIVAKLTEPPALIPTQPAPLCGR